MKHLVFALITFVVALAVNSVAQGGRQPAGPQVRPLAVRIDFERRIVEVETREVRTPGDTFVDQPRRHVLIYEGPAAQAFRQPFFDALGSVMVNAPMPTAIRTVTDPR